MKCPVCGEAELVHATRDLSYIYKGETTIIAQVEADWCEACGESLTGSEESSRVMEAMARTRQRFNEKR